MIVILDIKTTPIYQTLFEDNDIWPAATGNHPYSKCEKAGTRWIFNQSRL